MKKVTLHIENSYETKTVSVDDELTIGRTDQSHLVLNDSGLSRRNTTFFRDDDLFFVTDEGSLNGTRLNGIKISGPPQELRNGDIITIGTDTRIRVQIGDEFTAEMSKTREPETPVTASEPAIQQPAPSFGAFQNPKPQIQTPKPNRMPLVLLAAGLMTFVIVFGALLAYLYVSRTDNGNTNRTKPTPMIAKTSLIPVRVIDPLGGEDEDDLDDLIASWEVPEDEIKAENVSDVKVSATDTSDADLNVTAAFLADRQKKALEARNGETGIRPAALDVPKELFGDGVIKQKAKLREMNTTGYKQPLDFAELAEKRMHKDLIEMPMATQSFYLDVGGSAPDGPFQSFSFEGGDVVLTPGTPKYQILAQLAANFSGQKYDLNNPSDRKQMRMRLLRMFNPRAKPILKELADAYFGKFGRPLRVTSLTRSMDYQILLNKGNPNSFKVRGADSLPPHTSGCAFDLARKHMTAEEQNFVMKKLAEMEHANKLDALIEYGVNACFHIFIWSDGIPPKM
jgi:pSer/pThr/pTyr-binding forkhead associated (FHA) protein